MLHRLLANRASPYSLGVGDDSDAGIPDSATNTLDLVLEPSSFARSRHLQEAGAWFTCLLVLSFPASSLMGAAQAKALAPSPP
jgi:hypothetical protein